MVVFNKYLFQVFFSLNAVYSLSGLNFFTGGEGQAGVAGQCKFEHFFGGESDFLRKKVGGQGNFFSSIVASDFIVFRWVRGQNKFEQISRGGGYRH